MCWFSLAHIVINTLFSLYFNLTSCLLLPWFISNYVAPPPLGFTIWRNVTITLQPKTGYPLKLSRVEPDQYLDGRPPGKTRLLLEEVLVRPAGGAHPVVCVGPNTPEHHPLDETLNLGPDSLWSLKIQGCPSKNSRSVTQG